MKIVAFCGLAGSGKSTAAEYLADEYGFTRTRLATPLKAMLRAYLATVGVDGVTVERMIEGDLKEVPSDVLAGRTPRYTMQTLGCEFGRDIMGPSFWVHAWKRACDEALGAGAWGVCVEDVRFPDEAEAIRAKGGKVICIVRPGLTVGSHRSEAMGFSPDHTIRNDGPVEILCARLDGIMDRLARQAA